MNTKPLIPILAVVITASLNLRCDKDKKELQPNIILIMADDIGFSDIG